MHYSKHRECILRVVLLVSFLSIWFGPSFVSKSSSCSLELQCVYALLQIQRVHRIWSRAYFVFFFVCVWFNLSFVLYYHKHTESVQHRAFVVFFCFVSFCLKFYVWEVIQHSFVVPLLLFDFVLILCLKV